MAALHRLAPDFIKEGRLYWLRSPLWIVKRGKIEEYYYSDEELSHVKVNGELHRNKGLGSLSADQAKSSMFSPQYQRMDRLEYDDAAIKLLEELMGDKPEPRTKYIFENVDFSLIRE